MLGEVFQFGVLFLAGIIAGSYGSVVGGGSLVSFPALILFGFPVDVAIATNRFNAIFMEASSVVAFAKKKLIQWKYAVPLAVLAIPTSMLGARLVVEIRTAFINSVIAFALLCLLFILPRINEVKPKKSKKSQKLASYKSKKFALMSGATLLLSFYGGFYGAGFGTFILFPFALIGGSSLLEASGNARFVGLFMSIAASVVFVQQGLVDYSAAIPQLLGAIIGAQIGVHYATKLDSVWIKRGLVAVVIASAVKLIIDI